MLKSNQIFESKNIRRANMKYFSIPIVAVLLMMAGCDFLPWLSDGQGSITGYYFSEGYNSADEIE